MRYLHRAGHKLRLDLSRLWAKVHQILEDCRSRRPLGDYEIDRVDRLSQLCNAGVESSQRMSKKSSRSIESIVRP